MKTLGTTAVVVGVLILVLCSLGVVGASPRGLAAGAVVIVASGVILYSRGRRRTSV